MSRVRLIATDLDGTLLRNDGSISGRTRNAIADAQAAGLQVVFVTARPPRDVAAIASHLGITGMAVCSNGAIVHD
ncbi:MAG: HAD-IIB family hydrolase [Caulobacter sp.]|nr:HAD-IIB family hydrolase [Caulobacter sp.]